VRLLQHPATVPITLNAFGKVLGGAWVTAAAKATEAQTPSVHAAPKAEGGG